MEKDMVLLGLMFLIVLVLEMVTNCTAAVNENCDNECKTMDNINKHLATKTPYRFVANYKDNKLNFPNCKPTKLWMIVRHGTRYPSISFINKMRHRLPEIRDIVLEHNEYANDYLHNSDLDRFRKWKCNLKDAEAKMLAHEGEEEMLFLAERMQKRFPELLPPVYSNSSFLFKFTASARAKQSAKYFVAGLFGRQTLRDVWFPHPDKFDPLLRFYKLCQKWRKEIKTNVGTLEQKFKFEKSKFMKIAVKNLNERMNMVDLINFEDASLMYMTCAFETAWNKRTKSPWCAPFTLSTIKVMEFAEQLKYYWIDGYGYEITYKQACPLFRDAITSFTNPKEKHVAKVYFTHSGTIVKFLAHLGLYKDDTPLMASDYRSGKNISWDISYFDVFSSNLAFVLYTCGKNKYILTLNQERIIRLPCCPDTDLCSLQTILEYYEDSLGHCRFEEICANKKLEEVEPIAEPAYRGEEIQRTENE